LTVRRGNQVWSQDSPGIEGRGESGDRFGSALAAADFNTDGFADLAIGVPRETVGGSTGTGAGNALYGSAAGLQAASPADQLWHEGVPGVQGDPAPGNSFGSALAAMTVPEQAELRYR
jgi:hypothetical protein